MRIQSLYNAGLLIDADGARLLCDPWLTDGAYQGAWAIWPRPLTHPVLDIGKVNAIYISHVHPDHYDKTFLRQYLQHWGYTPILCGLESLAASLQADGFASAHYCRLFELSKRAVCLIVPNNLRRTQVDTALAVRCGDESLVDLNDNPYDEQQIKLLKAFCGEQISVAYLPFTGASGYPQRFAFSSEEECKKAGAAKKHVGLTRFLRYVEAFSPKYVVPFAGEYWLRGRLSAFNRLRGQNDATEAAAIYPHAVLPAGGAWFDAASGQASALRTEPYDAHQADWEILARPSVGYALDEDVPELAYATVEWRKLLNDAWHAAQRRLSQQPVPHVAVCVEYDLGLWVSVRFGAEGVCVVGAMPADSIPRLELSMDQRYLIGLLVGRYHWNDAEISSHVHIKRVPDVFDPSVFEMLEAWHV